MTLPFPMKPLRVLDLFSGIGAYSLGLERAGGFQTVAFCEIDPYCRRVLAKHWPDVPRYENVEDLTGARLAADGIAADFIVAGWPCQDISVAGTGHGLDGARSGLWPHIVRIARDIRCKGVLLENSTNLLAINGGRDFGTVLGDLASLGLHVEWHCLSAAAFDAPHIRDRLWIVGLASDSDCAGRRERRRTKPVSTQFNTSQRAGEAASDHSWHAGPEQSSAPRAERERVRPGGEPIGAAASDINGAWEQQSQGRRTEEWRRLSNGGSQPNAHPYGLASIGAAIARRERHQWEPEPGLARVVSGVAHRVHRIRALGNCNPPIIPETIGRAINEARGFQ